MIDHKKILKAIAAVPRDDRNSVITQISRLIESGTCDYSDSRPLARIIASISSIPHGERKDAVDQALRLIAPDMGYASRRVILEGIAAVLGKERANCVTQALLLIVPSMNYVDRRIILEAVAAVPDEERESLVAQILRLITPDMGSLDRKKMLEEIAAVPEQERAAVIEQTLFLITPKMNAAARIEVLHEIRHGVVDVHAGNRDQMTRQALELLKQTTGELTAKDTELFVHACIQYVQNRPEDFKRGLALRALEGPQIAEDSFGPLLPANAITVSGLSIPGKEVIARLWRFADSYEDVNASTIEYGREQIKHDIFSALADSYDEDGSLVCNPGKIQRLVLVLQGRLPGVNIDHIEMNAEAATAASVNLFLGGRRAITVRQELMLAAEQFCNENPLINRTEFMKNIQAYCELQELQ